MQAIGYGGIIPGILIGRYKIGLSRSPQNRLEQLHSAQPCCDIQIIHTVYVKSMAEVEDELHSVFKKQNVKLAKSREWFNLNPIQVQQCIWLMNRYERSRPTIPVKAIAGSLIALLGMGMLIGQSFQPESINQTRIEKSVKSK
jgi:hypothetical protein